MKKVSVILLIVFVVIQFFRIDKTNPTVDPVKDFLTVQKTPSAIASKIKASCYDCHSNETTYPWYSNLQPVAWFLKHHIDEGRHHLNFSEFANYDAKKQAHKLEECVEMLEKDEMPLSSYTILHSEAKLTEQEKKDLIMYFKQLESKSKTPNSSNVKKLEYDYE